MGPTGVRRSSNGGASFAAVNASIALGRRHGKQRKVALSSFNLARGAELAGGAIFAFGSDVLESTNGGGSWTLLPRPLPRRPGECHLLRQPHDGLRGVRWPSVLHQQSWPALARTAVGKRAQANVGSIAQISFSNAEDGSVLGKLQGEEDVMMRTEDGSAAFQLRQVIDFRSGP